VAVPPGRRRQFPERRAILFDARAARLRHEKHRVRDEQAGEQCRIETADPAVEAHHGQDHGGADHDRHLLPHSWRWMTRGAIRAVRPRMNSTLKMLLPTTLPTAMSLLPRRAAPTETAVSAHWCRRPRP